MCVEARMLELENDEEIPGGEITIHVTFSLVSGVDILAFLIFGGRVGE
jgi:hypothetical protein